MSSWAHTDDKSLFQILLSVTVSIFIMLQGTYLSGRGSADGIRSYFGGGLVEAESSCGTCHRVPCSACTQDSGILSRGVCAALVSTRQQGM